MPEEPRQGLIVPFGQFGRPVQCDAEGRRLEVIDVEENDVGLGPAELPHGCHAAIAADDPIRGTLDDQGLGLPESGKARLDGGQIGVVVGPSVGRVLMQLVESHARDLHLPLRRE